MADYRQMTRAAAQAAGIDPDIYERQIGAESGFNPAAGSPAGARGIAQIMPETARGWGVDPMDPQAALTASAGAMAKYLRSYKGDWSKALAAYNAGPGAVAKYGGVPPYRETQNYIKKILSGRNPRTSLPALPATSGQGGNQESIDPTVAAILTRGGLSPLVASLLSEGDAPARVGHQAGASVRTMRGAPEGASAESLPAGPVNGKFLTGKTRGINPALAARLSQIGQAIGKPINIVSGMRSRAEQAALYQKYLNGTGNLAAKPGSSNHESGGAADAYVGGKPLASVLTPALQAKYGIHFPVRGEAWHVEIR